MSQALLAMLPDLPNHARGERGATSGLPKSGGPVQDRDVKPTVILIPVLLVIGGVVTSMMVPLPTWMRAMIIAGDCCMAVAVGLILWRRGQG